MRFAATTAMSTVTPTVYRSAATSAAAPLARRGGATEKLTRTWAGGVSAFTQPAPAPRRGGRRRTR